MSDKYYQWKLIPGENQKKEKECYATLHIKIKRQ